MNRARTLFAAFVVVISVTVGGSAVAQEDLVTMTVAVSTPGGAPVGDATITATWTGGSRERTTVSDGRTLIDVPDGEDVELSVDHPDYVRNFPVTVEDASARELSLTVYPKSTASVTVTDGNGPVSDADVTFRKDRRDVVEATTDDDGVVTSGTIESGDYTVVVSKAGYYVAEEEIDVSGDTEVDVSIRRGTVTLEVNVTDDHFDPPRPVGGVNVDVQGSGSVTTQPGGIGRISVPVNAWTRLAATKDGYQTTEESVFVSEEDERVEITIQRTPAISTDLLNHRVVIGERVSLSVTDEYGDPVSGAIVRLNDEYVTETGDNGQAVIQITEAGNHTVVSGSGSLSSDPEYVVGVTEAQAAEGELDPEETDGNGSTGVGDETEVELPGFGLVVALVALAVAVLLGLAGQSKHR